MILQAAISPITIFRWGFVRVRTGKAVIRFTGKPIVILYKLPSGKWAKITNRKDPPFLMGKSTMNGHFNSYVSLPESIIIYIYLMNATSVISVYVFCCPRLKREMRELIWQFITCRMLMCVDLESEIPVLNFIISFNFHSEFLNIYIYTIYIYTQNMSMK